MAHGRWDAPGGSGEGPRTGAAAGDPGPGNRSVVPEGGGSGLALCPPLEGGGRNPINASSVFARAAINPEKRLSALEHALFREYPDCAEAGEACAPPSPLAVSWFLQKGVPVEGGRGKTRFRMQRG